MNDKLYIRQGGGVELYNWIRIFATFSVVVGHCAYLKITTQLGGVDYVLPDYASSAYFSVIFKFLRMMSGWMYGFHMPLFFMLSGAVLNLKPLKEFDSFCLSKIRRLIVPFFLYGFFFMLPIKFLGKFYTADSILEAYRAFSVGGESGHLWFLPALFWCMLAFVIIRKIFVKFGVKSVAPLLLVTGIIQISYSELPFDFFSLKSGLSYIFYFAVGFSFEIVRPKFEKLNRKTVLLLFFVCTVALCIETVFSPIAPFLRVFARSFWLLLLSLLCCHLPLWIKNLPLIQILNRNLFNIYLFHDPLEYLCLRLFFSNRLSLLHYSAGVFFYYFARTVGVIVLSICIGEILGKIKEIALRRNCFFVFR